MKHDILSSILAAGITVATFSVHAQVQTTGTLGSPSSTTTIDGKQLPPPPMPFGGVIKESALDSKPYWPPRIVPPKGAPNILLIMTDDQGYSVFERFRRRHPDARAGSYRQGGTTLHPISFHCAVLAHARGADHGPQP